MTAQPALFRTPAPVPVTDRMKPNQRTAWELITSTPGGVYADEIGAAVHATLTTKWRHSIDERCKFCASTGLGLIRSKKLAPLVVKHHGGKIEPREARYRASEANGQTDDLTGLFGGEAA